MSAGFTPASSHRRLHPLLNVRVDCDLGGGTPFIFNPRLCGASLLGKLGLSQTHILSHLADQESQVNPMQGALEGLAVPCGSDTFSNRTFLE